MDGSFSRKAALKAMLLTAAGASMPLSVFGQEAPKPVAELTLEDLKSIEKIAELEFTDEERERILADVRSSQKDFEGLREVDVEQKVAPAVDFHPLKGSTVPKPKVEVRTTTSSRLRADGMSDVDLAFLSARELGHLIRTKQVTSRRLTQIYLDRLQRYSPELLFLLTPTTELAMRQAEQADAEIARGHYRGPLHGLPYGIKDLFAVRGYPTTYGAEPFESQKLDHDATVVRRLEEAGAVLLGKLSMGALAMDDHWFRGKTKNPWNPKEGSSGSSAGSASATAAGCVAFSIGTETQGSITSPSQRCRVSGLRPTFGRVSRFGAMELSYTMDKVGPICRSAEDCALVFAAICGSDPNDPTAVDQPFSFRSPSDLKGLRIGFEPGEARMADDPLVKILREAGATVVPHKFSPSPKGVGVVLDVECASAFDDLVRSGRINEVKESLWPGFMRAARHIPAVEYLRAQRVRRVMMERFEQEFGDLDMVVDYGMALGTIVTSNQAGTPQAIIPFGTDDKGNPRSYSFLGRAYQEGVLLAVADYVQRRTDFHRRRPNLG
jgi:Asp-tRNA(Asn)/Glu-tRNA(Gln) amidotransferase A subunit family amidase/Asp-tRNA(Asn)/Glu-tRNA(Gln) amidotransferase C subunit